MALATNLGFPRIGPKRELKRAVERFWSGKIEERELGETSQSLRKLHWSWQTHAGLDQVPTGDFSLYDQMLDTSAMVGAVPPRFGQVTGEIDLATYFAMARGVAGEGRTGTGHDQGVPAMEMTKWFDTNYHYLVPELERNQEFRLASNKPLDEFLEAKQQGVAARPVLVGPVTYLLLSKCRGEEFDRLSLLDGLLHVYIEVLRKLADAGAEWVQLDEPCLVTDLGDDAREALRRAYARLAEASPVKILVATYFGPLEENAETALALPVAGLHVDLVRGPKQLDALLPQWPTDKVLSAGVVDGRNVWRCDLAAALAKLQQAADAIGGDRLMVAPSCSLLHSPVDLGNETKLDDQVRSWMAFARQKLDEIAVLTRALNEGPDAVHDALDENARAMEDRRGSSRTHDKAVRERMAGINDDMLRRRHEFSVRQKTQKDSLGLPPLPTTTIGSFPQTPEIRKTRAAYRRGELEQADYEKAMKDEIAGAIRMQDEVGIDVLVHGEPERNDMVEYFGEQMTGFVTSANGWVQSYGSRCVKPPIIYGDVKRPEPMTVDWIRHAASLTARPVKGMLTGPVTILGWSFVRDDQPRSDTCRQIALAIRDEVNDLEAAGVRIIQIDEPAFREGTPLRVRDREEYFAWAVDCFRLSSCGVEDGTQIHTHMCYCEFNDTLPAIAAMDADVISIETSRSDMELLDAFAEFKYPNEIGPGVYDIHSPQVPTREAIERLLRKALEVLDVEQLWVNPDCGLKTRRWEEVTPALKNMVAATETLRSEVGAGAS